MKTLINEELKEIRGGGALKDATDYVNSVLPELGRHLDALNAAYVKALEDEKTRYADKLIGKIRLLEQGIGTLGDFVK